MIIHNSSVHARYLVSYRPPYRVINEYGYNVECIQQFSTKMFGSGEIHMAYFYRRLGPFPEIAEGDGVSIITIPAREGVVETDEEVACADAFITAVQLASGDIFQLKEKTKEQVMSFLNSGRPQRTRRARVNR